MTFVTKNMYFTIAFLSHENGKFQGVLHSPVLKDSVHFQGLIELITIMEKIMQDMNIPKYDSKYRTLTTKKSLKNMQLTYQDLTLSHYERYLDNSMTFPKESEDIFNIKVMYRQHNTWQGEIIWLNKKKTKFFRSALELLEMIYFLYD